jgi:pterin-4a-carbinolamine dehydratase
MEQTMTWEAAVQLVAQIADSADSGNWHAQVEAVENGYAVAVRQHNTSTLYYLSNFRAFVALCDRLSTPGRG